MTAMTYLIYELRISVFVVGVCCLPTCADDYNEAAKRTISIYQAVILANTG